MTSGQFRQVEIASIIVNRESRQRREPTPEHIAELADSIHRLGLIHPIVVTRGHELVAGECRLIALKRLGWSHTPVHYTDELRPSQLRAIELEENVKRRDLPWQDQVSAVLEFHNLMKAENANWSQDKTADAIGLSRQQANSMLVVAEEVARGNQKIIDLPKFTIAEGILRRAKERQDEQTIRDLKESVIGLPDSDQGASASSILTCDFRVWVNQHHSPRFNFIHCDFPYGIEADTFNQGASSAHGGYADTRETWHDLMVALEAVTDMHTTDSCHLMFWFAMRKGDERLYEPTISRLTAMGWDMNPLPLIWMKSDGVGIIPDPERGPRQIYETCLFGSRGDRKIVRAVANGYSAPTVRDKHMSEKPEPVLRHFFSMFVDANTIMLDPTCGSGSALRAAESLGAKYVLGLELNAEFADLAREALKRHRALRRAETTIKETV